MRCKNCDVVLITTDCKQKYCSIECRVEFNQKQKHKSRTESKLSNKQKCEHCGVEFLPHFCTGRQKFCSTACKEEHHKAKKRSITEQLLKEDPNVCQHCSEKFVAHRQDQKFCSRNCKSEFYKQIYREQNAAIRSETTKTCPVCELNFSPSKSLRQIYCSAHCRNLFQKKIYKALQTCYNYMGEKKQDHSHDLLGYTPKQLQEHIHSHPNWPNCDKVDWHLDHIFPIIAFLEHGIKNISVICCLENLQPLPGKANCQKNATYHKADFQKWLQERSCLL